ncbi:MAG: tRNA (adenosine(37)-N6)-dimethylallyltransferase MiaA [Actinomyces dentalis]
MSARAVGIGMDGDAGAGAGIGTGLGTRAGIGPGTGPNTGAGAVPGLGAGPGVGSGPDACAARSAPVRVAVVGPTASGKSELALDLIEALADDGAPAIDGDRGAGGDWGAEVVNADASQLYRGMDIGTAKLPLSQRRGVPHHQIDVLTVREEASVAAYQVRARADARAVEARGARVLIVGGSGLYVRALTDDLDFPGTDPQIRAALEARAAAVGGRALWEELRRADPAAAERIEAANTRRVVRALEVLAVTGRPFSATLPRYEDLVPTVHLALRPERAALNARIDARARAIFDAGLIEEVRALADEGLAEGTTAPRAIGYAQALAVLDGTMSREEAVEATAAATRKLASRQIKWFRRDPRVHWIDVALEPGGDWAPGERERVTRRALELVRAGERALAPGPVDGHPR